MNAPFNPALIQTEPDEQLLQNIHEKIQECAESKSIMAFTIESYIEKVVSQYTSKTERESLRINNCSKEEATKFLVQLHHKKMKECFAYKASKKRFRILAAISCYTFLKINETEEALNLAIWLDSVDSGIDKNKIEAHVMSQVWNNILEFTQA